MLGVIVRPKKTVLSRLKIASSGFDCCTIPDAEGQFELRALYPKPSSAVGLNSLDRVPSFTVDY